MRGGYTLTSLQLHTHSEDRVTAVPDYIPMLVKGASRSPEQGGCLVQIANWLADPSTWTDGDVCVDGLLAQHAVFINDSVDETHRHQLAVLAPRLAGTKGVASMGVYVDMYAWIAAHDCPVKIASTSDFKYTENGGEVTITTSVVHKGTHQDAVDWLFALVAEFERLTAHQPEELSVERWREVKELVGQ